MDDNTINEQGTGESVTPVAVEVTKTDCDINRGCTQIMNDFMNAEQDSLNRQNMLISRLQYIAEQSGRADITEAITELKEKVIGDETEHWDIAKNWHNFFSGITTEADKDETEVYGEPDGDADDAENGDTGDDTVKTEE